MTHTYITTVNGYRINHWSLGEKYYIEHNGEWLVENASLDSIIEFAESQPSAKFDEAAYEHYLTLCSINNIVPLTFKDAKGLVDGFIPGEFSKLNKI
ncbi:hypothetical protein SAMN04487895_101578 [Paenibacillus sophorae]|uniref:Uncharacterized protein n=1 Tax=Paenibacillus sophorae TaxID=1333845 RepID=A0A1H8GP85_9BACL|nr:hypothetical protein [Paenibacillus sophorae]QWU14281.1 hypothetical protein KP014_20455 [Paenibacillus sophorae]SEN45317.1 hypothetical protein SAMN04487895_101578 [Paenibacillus sophorae]